MTVICLLLKKMTSVFLLCERMLPLEATMTSVCSTSSCSRGSWRRASEGRSLREVLDLVSLDEAPLQARARSMLAEGDANMRKQVPALLLARPAWLSTRQCKVTDRYASRAPSRARMHARREVCVGYGVRVNPVA